MSTTFLGILSIHARPPFTYAALDDDRRVVALGQGSLADVLAFAAGFDSARVGIGTPARPANGCLADPAGRARFDPSPPSRLAYLRVADYEMIRRGVGAPVRVAAEGSPRWVQRSLALVEQLAAAGFAAHPAEDAPRQWLETPAEGVFAALLGMPSFACGTLESRLQRQLALHRCRVHLPDPMDFFEEVTPHRLLNGILPTRMIHSAAELNALAAAYTAWLTVHNPAGVMAIGDPAEALCWLPASDFFHNPPPSPGQRMDLPAGV